MIDSVAKGTVTHDGRQTVSSFLDDWLEQRIVNGLRPTTAASYRQHIDDHFKPAFGNVRLRDLRAGHISALLTQLAAPREKQRTPEPTSIRGIHATLREARSAQPCAVA